MTTRSAAREPVARSRPPPAPPRRRSRGGRRAAAARSRARPPAPAPGSRSSRRAVPVSRSVAGGRRAPDHLGQPAEGRPPAAGRPRAWRPCPAALRRAGALEAQQGHVHVGGEDQLDAREALARRGQPGQRRRRRGRPGRGPAAREVARPRRPRARPACPAPPSLVPLPPRPTTMPGGALGQRRLEQLPDAVRAGPAGFALVRARAGAARRPGPTRRMRCGRRPCSTTSSAAGTGRPSGSLTVTATVCAAEGAGEDVEEARAAVGQRQQGQPVVRRSAPPALGDGLGGLAWPRGCR